MQNQLNRYGGDNTQPAAATHTRGSISHSEILERLTTLLGRVPTSHELFAYTHTKRHDGSSWSDPRAQAVEEEYVRAVAASLQSEENRAEDVLEMYYQVVGGRNKKHRLYGLGDAACRYYGSASSQCPPNTSGASTSASPDPYSHMQSQFDRSNQIVQTLVDSQERHDEGMQRGHESRQIHLGVTCEDIEEIKKNQHDLEVQMRDQIGSLQDVIARFRLELTELRQNREQHSSSQVDSINDDDLDDLT
ncbi:uncharacterized protein [Euphorbia lathyris]|uniref:uncharacterized protein n=1 Tax=Euphorbia lathyris TaxID=212925 RepID=UPI0033143380